MTNKIAKLLNQSKLAIITPSVTVNEVYLFKYSFYCNTGRLIIGQYMTSFLVAKRGFLDTYRWLMEESVSTRVICKIVELIKRCTEAILKRWKDGFRVEKSSRD